MIDNQDVNDSAKTAAVTIQRDDVDTRTHSDSSKRRQTRTRSRIHRPNGPYYPVGDLGYERCVKCEKPWPCPDYEYGPRMADGSFTWNRDVIWPS